MKLQPIARTSVSDAVFDQISDQIVRGDIAAGAALPAERALTEALGVNRQAVREALKRLGQAGLVDVRQGDATRVLDYRVGAGLDLLPRLLVRADGSVDPSVARSIMEMRASIGPDLARSCATRATPDQVTRLGRTTDAMALAHADADAAGALGSESHLDALAAFDLDFWDALVDGADNIAYRLALNSLRKVVEAGGAPLRHVLADELRDLELHRAVHLAVEAGDPDRAEAAARSLLARGTAAVNALLVALGEESAQ